ncbi:TonB family protein [Parashewanella spongiae]|uniref:TonB family protein n=1 Tax=Parashewanella spongiae TaxID=342950 RepID=A0A3A6TPI9_9GAMM|nr:TonB family protein [Parashewanella spongiae]MCL1080290.1 energy transducer TonB [Parashewanella spongiae]RJY07055.1 TonB family protein [Parashewanella spongiae]
MKHLALILLGFALVGCKSTPEKFLSTSAVKIEQAELSKYWLQKDDEFSFEISTRKTPTKNGTVFLNYLIDSNGEIFDAKIMNSTPNHSWDKFALKALENTKYINAESNPNKTPVIVTTKIDFEAK